MKRDTYHRGDMSGCKERHASQSTLRRFGSVISGNMPQLSIGGSLVFDKVCERKNKKMQKKKVDRWK